MSDAYPHFKFKLMVTGKTERGDVANLFNSLAATMICNFKVEDFIGQRTPRQNPRTRTGKITVGETEKKIPTRDEYIGLNARAYLTDKWTFVIFLDDLEYDRRKIAFEVFDRYRRAIDNVLTDEQKKRVSVHFLVNMLEAYYFADAKSINNVLGTKLADYGGDVEDIRHPKHDIEKHYTGFREKEHGGSILNLLDSEHVLRDPATCASLRTLFLWCVKILETHPFYEHISISDKFQLEQGILSVVTGRQLR